MTTELKNDLASFFNDSLLQSHYYLKDVANLKKYNPNIYNNIKWPIYSRMFDNGNGGELIRKDGNPPKALAIHSSSMLAYNFFSWIDEKNPFIYRGVKYTKVVFEEQLKVLMNGTSDGDIFKPSNAKANMDVVLYGADDAGRPAVLFIESKFTEHLSNAQYDMKDMALSYSYPKSYYYDGENWSSLVRRWKEKVGKRKGYLSGIKQDICHLVSISNLMNGGEPLEWFNTNKTKEKTGSWLKKCYGITLKGKESVRFMNVLFSPSNKYKDHIDYSNYIALYDDFEKDVKQLIPDGLDIGLTSYINLWKEMKGCIHDEGLVRYLENRYIKYQE